MQLPDETLEYHFYGFTQSAETWTPLGELQARNYLERNPVKAAKDWPWSSARFRDEYA